MRLLNRLKYGRIGTPTSKVLEAASAAEPVESPALGDSAATPVEDAALGCLARLPPFSPIAVSLLRLFDQDDVEIAAVVRLVRSDAALAAELLAYANSPLFGVPQSISDLTNAILVIGIDQARAMTTTLAMRSLLQGAPKTGVVRRIWRHSLATATIAAELASIFGVSPELAETTGIVHDLGRAGLLAAHQEAYSVLLLRYHESTQHVLEAEVAACGMDHCTAGIYLARKWGFPEVFHEPIAGHHEKPCGLRLLGVTQTACLLADDFGYSAAAYGERPSIEARLEQCIPEHLREGARPLLEVVKDRISARIQALDF
ncbi:MAG: HDOD domain-containing protein [Acidobacteria bacterium]|nr:HDOD domain-containing protein [Acidobacteriota bacterium]